MCIHTGKEYLVYVVLEYPTGFLLCRDGILMEGVCTTLPTVLPCRLQHGSQRPEITVIRLEMSDAALLERGGISGRFSLISPFQILHALLLDA
jgi:hypothetical protein